MGRDWHARSEVNKTVKDVEAQLEAALLARGIHAVEPNGAGNRTAGESVPIFLGAFPRTDATPPPTRSSSSHLLSVPLLLHRK